MAVYLPFFYACANQELNSTKIMWRNFLFLAILNVASNVTVECAALLLYILSHTRPKRDSASALEIPVSFMQDTHLPFLDIYRCMRAYM